MDKFVIKNNGRLRGSVHISGSKNSALPIMAASLLTDEPCTIRGVPDLADVQAMCQLLNDLGVQTAHDDDGCVQMQVTDESNCHADYERVRKMRASICVLGPLLAKRKKARVAMPGGCAIGSRH